MKTNNLDKKNFIWNIIGTTLSSFNSLFFMIIVTRINGIERAGIFSFAFSFACLLYIVGIYSGRVFQVTDNDSNNDSFSYINSHIISCFMMLVLTMIFCIFRNYAMYKFIIILLLVIFKMLEAFSETLYAIIQSQNNLYKVGISLFVKAIISLLLFLIIDYIFKDIILAIISIILSNFLVILLYDIKNTKLSIKNYQFNYAVIKKIFRLGFWTFVFTFLNLYIINLSKYLIDFICKDDIQTIFGIIVMPATVVSMFAQFVIHPLLLKIKEYVKDNDYLNLIKISYKISFSILIFGLISICILYFLGIPILNFIYGIDLSKYKSYLLLVLLGATFYSIMTVYSNILVACRKTISQTIIYILVSLLCTFISLYLIKNYYMGGAVYSYLISMLILLISFIVLFIKVVVFDVKKESSL